MKVLNSIHFSYGKVELLDNFIVRLEMFDDVVIGYDECKQLNDAIGELTNQKEALILMVPNQNTNFAPEARTFSASEDGLRYTIADALITKNLAHNILTSFYLKFNKPQKPSKVFNNETDAMNWLLSLPK